MVEPLEGRLMLSGNYTPHAVRAARITSMSFDNRGLITMFTSVPLDTSTLTYKTASVYTAGADTQIGTSDDVRLRVSVGFRKGKLTIVAPVAVNQSYRVRLNAAAIKDTNGRYLDGEFNGDGKWSGNAVAGGNFEAVCTFPTVRPRVQFTTNYGYINVGLYKSVDPTLNNFAYYANKGASANGGWDGTFFHRSEANSGQQGDTRLNVLQGGGFYTNANKQVDSIPTNNHPGIATDAKYQNDQYTLAMANTGQANSNTNQWYFNMTANHAIDGGYTVFGKILDTASINVAKTLWGKPVRDFSGGSPSSPFSQLPVADAAVGVSRSIVIPNDLIVINRIAYLANLAAPLQPFPQAKAPASVPGSSITVPPPTSTFAATTSLQDDLLA